MEYQGANLELPFFFFSIFLFLLLLFRAAPAAYGGSQARGQIGTAAASLHHSQSHSGSVQHLWPPPGQHQVLDPLSEARDWTHNLMVSSWIHFHCATMGTPWFRTFKNCDHWGRFTWHPRPLPHGLPISSRGKQTPLLPAPPQPGTELWAHKAGTRLACSQPGGWPRNPRLLSTAFLHPAVSDHGYSAKDTGKEYTVEGSFDLEPICSLGTLYWQREGCECQVQTWVQGWQMNICCDADSRSVSVASRLFPHISVCVCVWFVFSHFALFFWSKWTEKRRKDRIPRTGGRDPMNAVSIVFSII